MTFVITAGFVWMLAALVVATLLGRGIRLADEAVEAPVRTDVIEQFRREQAAVSVT